MVQSEPTDAERQHLERTELAGVCVQLREIQERKIVAELLVAGNSLVVVDEVSTTVEDQAVSVYLDRFRMMRRVAVDNVDRGVIDQRMRERRREQTGGTLFQEPGLPSLGAGRLVDGAGGLALA